MVGGAFVWIWFCVCFWVVHAQEAEEGRREPALHELPGLLELGFGFVLGVALRVWVDERLLQSRLELLGGSFSQAFDLC